MWRIGWSLPNPSFQTQISNTAVLVGWGWSWPDFIDLPIFWWATVQCSARRECRDISPDRPHCRGPRCPHCSTAALQSCVLQVAVMWHLCGDKLGSMRCHCEFLGRVNTVDNLYNLLNKYLVLPHFTAIPPDGWRIGKLDPRREDSGELNLQPLNWNCNSLWFAQFSMFQQSVACVFSRFSQMFLPRPFCGDQ